MQVAIEVNTLIKTYPKTEYSLVVLHSPVINLGVIVAMGLGMPIIGTKIFVSKEQNR